MRQGAGAGLTGVVCPPQHALRGRLRPAKCLRRVLTPKGCSALQQSAFLSLIILKVLRFAAAVGASPQSSDLAEAWHQPLQAANGRPPVVALGKFDALHVGHRALAAQAAELGGAPWLVSFTGMAEVLGWPKRPPLVPECDFDRILQTWAPFCQNFAPSIRLLPFSAVRSMSAEEFVRFLAHELQIAGIVVGQGYRFGYKQAGDTEALQKLGQRAGITVAISDLIEASGPGFVGKVSSTEVRKALSLGNLSRVQSYLGRQHRLIAQTAALESQGKIQLAASCFLNQLPGHHRYIGDVLFQDSQGKEVGWPRSLVIVEQDVVTVVYKGGSEQPIRQRVVPGIVSIDLISLYEGSS